MTKMNKCVLKSKTIVLAASLTTMLSISAFATAQTANQSERRGPPPEAYSACSMKAASASCSVKTSQGDKNGTCKSSVTVTSRLVCVPSEMANRHNAALAAATKR